ncbi:hypothetical protein M758_4G215800 [Ceratodon purpureus]|nr:hypothetical protein M758_4G215800 [Ceratodon purpureus]
MSDHLQVLSLSWHVARAVTGRSNVRPEANQEFSPVCVGLSKCPRRQRPTRMSGWMRVRPSSVCSRFSAATPPLRTSATTLSLRSSKLAPPSLAARPRYRSVRDLVIS